MLRCILIFTSLLLLYGTSALPTPKPFPPASCQINSNVPLPHPTLCGAYYVCLYGVYRLRFCEAGKIFNETHCVKGSCPVWCPQENAAVPHPDYCSVYYQCHKWTASLLPCYEGGFDPIRRNCSLDYPCHDGLFDLKSNPGIRKHSHSKESSSSSSSSSEESKDDEIFQCPSKNGNYPDPYFCNMYFECKKQKAKFHICRRGEAFDSKSGHCKRHGSGICGPKPVLEPSCDRRKDVFFHPEYCSVYIQCDKNKLDVKRCKKGEGFNPYEKKCDKKYNCKKDDGEDFQCPRKDGKFPHPTSCDQYYLCRRSKAKLEKCFSGKKFNSDSGDCEKDFPCVENDKPDFKCPRDSGSYKHSRCDRYYKCQHGLSQLRSCRKGKAFNVNRGECLKNDNCVDGHLIIPTTSTTPGPTTTKSPLVIIAEDFVCLTEYGYFVHPMSKRHFINCYEWKPSLGKCGDNKEFYEKLGRCIAVELITTETPTEPTEPTVAPTEPTEASTEAPTEPTVAPTEPTEAPSPWTTTEGPTTTKSPLVIIAEDFVCPTEYGYFVHPLSKRHFINCYEWKPSLGKCGANKEFDQKLGRCVAVELITTEIPTDAPTEPTEPTVAPTVPTVAPTEPTEAPTEPTDSPTEPTIAPTEPTEAPTEPTEAPTEPPTQPTVAPTEPTEAPSPKTTTEGPTTTKSPLVIEAESFECPTEYGYFVHPMSKKHFINCYDWNPSLGKCGANKEFDQKLGRCLEHPLITTEAPIPEEE